MLGVAPGGAVSSGSPHPWRCDATRRSRRVLQLDWELPDPRLRPSPLKTATSPTVAATTAVRGLLRAAAGAGAAERFPGRLPPSRRARQRDWQWAKPEVMPAGSTHAWVSRPRQWGLEGEARRGMGRCSGRIWSVQSVSDPRRSSRDRRCLAPNTAAHPVGSPGRVLSPRSTMAASQSRARQRQRSRPGTSIDLRPATATTLASLQARVGLGRWKAPSDPSRAVGRRSRH
jgi:hypothetical protein